MWAPIGERPIAHGHHRFDWLYVTAFVSPATGETFWYVSNGVSKDFFEALLATFAELDEKIAAQCIALAEQREQIQSRTGFHWWPNPIAPN